ncbi:MAG: tetratricopeptide repeat protein [Bacteroidota bacterium]|nr:tetratricopeptide repeat protein [Bacteroidota bacterium]
MRKINITQVSVVICAVISTVLLSFVSTVAPVEKIPAVHSAEIEHGHTLEEQVANARKGMKSDVLIQVNAVEGAISTNRDAVKRVQMYDSIVRFLGINKEYVYAAWLTEQKAAKNNGSGSDWQQAGDRYRVAAGFQRDEHNLGALFEAAIRCYSKALELEPKNLEAMVGLGSCIVQGTSDPMQGISLLLKVDSIDSTNVNAQLELAQFSLKRNAPDKAIARYSRALRLRPDYYGLHLNLAELYEQMGDIEQAIYHLEQYVQIETDPLTKNDVENAIRKLRARLPEPK